MASASKLTGNTASVVGATTALVLLTALNFVNYIDRYILPGVQEQIKGEFHISDAQIRIGHKPVRAHTGSCVVSERILAIGQKKAE